MSKVVYDASTLGTMKLFENMTRAKVRDCIVEPERLIFVVDFGELRKALGKGAENIKRLSEKFQKRVKVVEYNEDMLKLIQNFIHPLKVDAIHEEDGIVILESADTKTKGLLIGRAAKNLRALEENIKRYFANLKEIKVM
jgi:N utilization substance protein A